MPLRLRLAVLFALGTAVVIAAAGLVFVLQLRVSLDASLDIGLRARAMALAAEVGTDGGPQPIGSSDEITQIRTLDGRLLASSPAAGAKPLLDARQRQQALVGAVSFTATVSGDRSRLLATTVLLRDGRRVLVVVGTGSDVSDTAVDHVQSALLIGGPPAVLLAAAGAWLLAGAALRPVERMRRQAAEISDRDTGRRLAVPATRDEIAALGTTINALLARLQEALERERGFVADAGHELRTPLAILRAELELAARPGRSRDSLVEAVSRAGQETDRLIRLAEDLLLLARADNDQPFLHPVALSLPVLLAAAARGAGARAAARAVVIEVHTSPRELTIDADPARLRQAVDNLLANATRYAPPGSIVELSTTTRAPTGATPTVTIEVADRGPGFPPEFLPHAFERFHRAEAARARQDGGTGLGLSIVRAITEAHGGRVTADNRPGGGAAVTIELPTTAVDPSSAPPRHHNPDERPSPPGRARGHCARSPARRRR